MNFSDTQNVTISPAGAYLSLFILTLPLSFLEASTFSRHNRTLQVQAIYLLTLKHRLSYPMRISDSLRILSSSIKNTNSGSKCAHAEYHEVQWVVFL